MKNKIFNVSTNTLKRNCRILNETTKKLIAIEICEIKYLYILSQIRKFKITSNKKK